MSSEPEDDYPDVMMDEEMMEAGEEFMAQQAAGVGLDPELISIAEITPDEKAALESCAIYSTEINPNDRANLNRAVLRLLTATVYLRGLITTLRSEVVTSRAQPRRDGSAFVFVVLSLVVLFMLALITFRSEGISVDPTNDSVIHVSKSWWGFSRRERKIVWMQPAGDNSCWATQNAVGEWYCFIREYDRE